MMVYVLNAVVFLLLHITEVISTCPPDSGIYLILNGECRSNGTYFKDSDLDISKPNSDNHLHCVLPDVILDDGEWLRPDGEPVNCNDHAKSDPFLCTNTFSPNANITLYLNNDDDFAPLAGGNDENNVELQYKCCLPTNCSDPNTNIMIINVFERVYITEIYVDLPSNITVIPQYYTIHCIVIGSYVANVTHYYDNTQITESYCNEHGCSFKNETLHANNFTYDLSVKWKIGEYGDHYHKCDAQHGKTTRDATIRVTAPSSSPSIPTLVSNTFTSITINWTYPDISDTDGYVVNASSLNDYVIQQVNGSSVNETILNGLIPGTTYNITIRAYQDLLGPASEPLSVITDDLVAYWSRVSPITDLLETEYLIECLTSEIDQYSTLISWTVNGHSIPNMNYTLLLESYMIYNNTLIVYPNSEGESLNITCSVKEDVFSDTITIQAPIGVPEDVSVFILNETSIKVNWTVSQNDINGFIVLLSPGGYVNEFNNDVFETVITNLQPITYTISIYSYKDLPSLPTNKTFTIDETVPSSSSISAIPTSTSDISTTQSSTSTITHSTSTITQPTSAITQSTSTITQPTSSSTLISITSVSTSSTPTTTSEDEGFNVLPIAGGAVGGVVVILLLIVVVIVLVVCMRKRNENAKREKHDKEYESVKSQDYIHMQTCEPYGLHKATSHNTQEPEYYNLKPVDNIETQANEAYAIPKISPTEVIYDECNPPIYNQYENIRY